MNSFFFVFLILIFKKCVLQVGALAQLGSAPCSHGHDVAVAIHVCVCVCARERARTRDGVQTNTVGGGGGVGMCAFGSCL